MHDDKTESALSSLNWTGQIRPTDGDYLNINESNFAGGKSNLYVDENVSLTIDKDGTHHLAINFSNPQPYSSWLNQINRDYIRIYVPMGSKLNSSKGSDLAVNTLDDLGKTYFEGFVQIRPQNSRRLELNYTTPSYSDHILLQKQPGSKDFSYSVNSKSFKLSSD